MQRTRESHPQAATLFKQLGHVLRVKALRGAGSNTHLETLASLNHMQRAPARVAAQRAGQQHAFSLRSEACAPNAGASAAAQRWLTPQRANWRSALWCRPWLRKQARRRAQKRGKRWERSAGGTVKLPRGRARIVHVVVRLVLVVRPNQRGDMPHAVRALCGVVRQHQAPSRLVTARTSHAFSTSSSFVKSPC